MSAALRPKDINFYTVYYEKPTKSAQQKKKARQIMLPVLLALLLGGVYGFFEYQIYQINQRLIPVEALLQDANTKEAFTYAQEIEAKLSAALTERGNLLQANTALASYAKQTKRDFAAIDACFGTYATIDGIIFTSENAQLELTAVTTTVGVAADCAERLRSTGMFSAIDYFGYASEDKASYIFTVICTLKAVETE